VKARLLRSIRALATGKEEVVSLNNNFNNRGFVRRKEILGQNRKKK